jgi:hypothetical protein
MLDNLTDEHETENDLALACERARAAVAADPAALVLNEEECCPAKRRGGTVVSIAAV